MGRSLSFSASLTQRLPVPLAIFFCHISWLLAELRDICCVKKWCKVCDPFSNVILSLCCTPRETLVASGGKQQNTSWITNSSKQSRKTNMKRNMQTTRISVLSHSSLGLSEDHSILPLPTQNATAGMIFLAHYLDLRLCSIPLALHRAQFLVLASSNATLTLSFSADDGHYPSAFVRSSKK